MASYTTRYLAQGEHDQWDELVSQSPAYNIFDTTLWLDTLSSVLNCNIQILGVFNKGTLIGGVALEVVVKFRLKITNVPQISHFNSCHYVPRDTQYKERQSRYIQDIVMSITEKLQNDFHYVVIANHPEFKDIRGFLWKDWNQNVLYSYRAYLDKIDFTQLSSSKRGWIKKAQKKMIVTEEIKDITPVYGILERTYTRQGIKCPLTLDELSGICGRMGDNIVILAAKEQVSERYEAVIICFVDYKNSCVHDFFVGYEHESPGSGANALLRWEAMKYFKNRGFEYFDYGQAASPSKASFKGEFSTALVPFYRVSKSSLPFSIAWHLTKGRIVQVQ